jgi:hypothetical protein
MKSLKGYMSKFFSQYIVLLPLMVSIGPTTLLYCLFNQSSPLGSTNEGDLPQLQITCKLLVVPFHFPSETS